MYSSRQTKRCQCVFCVSARDLFLNCFHSFVQRGTSSEPNSPKEITLSERFPHLLEDEESWVETMAEAFPKLEVLNLARNTFLQIPEWFLSSRVLWIVILFESSPRPRRVYHISTLRHLDVSFNKITSVRESMCCHALLYFSLNDE